MTCVTCESEGVGHSTDFQMLFFSVSVSALVQVGTPRPRMSSLLMVLRAFVCLQAWIDALHMLQEQLTGSGCKTQRILSLLQAVAAHKPHASPFTEVAFRTATHLRTSPVASSVMLCRWWWCSLAGCVCRELCSEPTKLYALAACRYSLLQRPAPPGHAKVCRSRVD